jgi:hypothetical protein
VEIARVDVFGYELSYVGAEYVMSGGRVVTVLPSTVVRLTTGSPAGARSALSAPDTCRPSAPGHGRLCASSGLT